MAEEGWSEAHKVGGDQEGRVSVSQPEAVPADTLSPVDVTDVPATRYASCGCAF